MKKIIDYLTWGFLFVFFLPTTLIVASWNALPGDALYSTKLTLESTLLFFVQPSYAASGSLNVKYTERRFTETKRLLSDKQSVEGLPYLERQVSATKMVIDRAPNAKAKKQLAQTYLATLRDVSVQLEEQRLVAVARTPSPRPIVRRVITPRPTQQTFQTSQQETTQKSFFVPQIFTPEPTPTPTISPVPQLTEETPLESPQEQTIEEEITDTQDAIEDTIEDLEQILETQSTEVETESNNQSVGPPEWANQGEGQGQGQGNGQGNND